ncbi:MAG: hypothetical protein UGF89_12800 [Acutalibacteraceae bacterium]|nr:hypothetical protein [Acutalibacteraceae bacterium]
MGMDAMKIDAVKEVVLVFLKARKYSFVTASARDEMFSRIVEFFPFFKYIAVQVGEIRNNDGTSFHCISIKNNWFWLPSNSDRVGELRDDVRKISEFDVSDKAYADILSRVAVGDAYGIVKPITRYTNEKVNVTEIAIAVEFFKEHGLDVEDLQKEHGFKLVYCHKNEHPFSDFKAWVTCEKMYGNSLSYAEYLTANSVFYGDPQESLSSYGTQEYSETVSEMVKRINVFNESTRKALSVVFVDEIINSVTIPEAYKNLKSLREVWTSGEGCAKDVKRYRKDALKKYFAQIPEKLLDEILAYERSGGVT